MKERIDGLPQWEAESTQRSGRSLLDELIEEGTLTKDMVMPEGTFRVRTKIHCDEKACLFRCAVSFDDVEIEEEPWTAIFQSFAEEMAGHERKPEARREIARRALETHLTVCARVDHVLERHGHLLSPAKKGRGWLLGAGALLIAGTLAATWVLWPGSTTDPEAEGGVGSAAQGLLGEGEEPSEAGTGETSSTAEGPPSGAADESQPSGHAQTGGLPASRDASTVRPRSSPAEPRRKEARQPSGRRSGPRPASTPSGSEGVTSPDSGSQALAAPGTESPAEVASDLPTGSDAETPSMDRWPISTVLSPEVHFKPTLAPGAKLYLEDEIYLMRAPPASIGLRCVTTISSSGDTKQGIVFNLSAPSDLFVFHDQGVKRRPDWLGTFEQTGSMLKAAGLERDAKGVTYLMYRKRFPQGTVALGTNTGALGAVRGFKKLSGLQTYMYIVCAPTSDGQS